MFAGVPIIAGRDSAFRVVGQAGTNYREAVSVGDVKRHLVALNENFELRRRLVAHGLARSRKLDAPAIIVQWRSLIEVDIRVRALHWSRAGSALRIAHRMVGRVRESLTWRGMLMRSAFTDN